MGGGQRYARPDLPTGKTRYPLYRRLGGPQVRSGRVKKISPPLKSDPRTVQHVSSRYTDSSLCFLHFFLLLPSLFPSLLYSASFVREGLLFLSHLFLPCVFSSFILFLLLKSCPLTHSDSQQGLRATSYKHVASY